MKILTQGNGDPVPGKLWGSGPKHLTPALVSAWQASLDSWGASQAARDALSRLEAAHVVVTGQQPGVWGGPLYAAYKAATAISLAQAITEQTQEPAVAVFWMGADDTDHGEVRWGALPDPQGALFRHRWPVPEDSRSWIGDSVLEFPSTVPPWLPLDLPSWGSPHPQEAVALGDGFARFLYRLFQGLPLLVLDARWPEVSRAGADLWSRYVESHLEIGEAVRDRGLEMERKGAPAPLQTQGERGLFLTQERRRLALDSESWETTLREVLLSGGQVTPSVLMRAPLQDYILGSAAHVVGRAEIAYLAQLQPVYRRLEVHEPSRIPRFHGTLLPADWIPAEHIAVAVEDPEAYVSSLLPDRDEGAVNLEDRLNESFSSLEERFAENPGALESIRNAHHKMRYQLQKLEKSLDRQRRRKLYEEKAYLRNLPELLRPRRLPQDRGLSAATLWLWFGEGAGEQVVKLADRHIEALARGDSLDWMVEMTHE